MIRNFLTFSCLRISYMHILCFDQIHLPFSLFPFFSPPSNFSSHLHVLCLKPAFCILHCLCGCVLVQDSPWRMGSIPGAIALKKIVSLPQQVTFASSSTVRNGTSWTPPPAMLEFWLAGSCYYLVCAVTASESCGQQPCHAWKYCIAADICCLWLSNISLAMIPKIWRKGMY